MAGLRLTNLLVLIALLLTLPLVFALGENNHDSYATTSSLHYGNVHTTFITDDYKVLGNHRHVVENLASTVRANFTTFQVVTQPLAPSTLATFGVPGATIPSWTAPPIVISSSTLRTEVVKRAAIAMITTTITPLGTHDATSITSPEPVLSPLTANEKRDITASSALPCVPTLVTYGLPGESLVGWTPPVQSCPTTLITSTTGTAL